MRKKQQATATKTPPAEVESFEAPPVELSTVPSVPSEAFGEEPPEGIGEKYEVEEVEITIKLPVVKAHPSAARPRRINCKLTNIDQREALKSVHAALEYRDELPKVGGSFSESSAAIRYILKKIGEQLP
jgi:hypothetical protein